MLTSAYVTQTLVALAQCSKLRSLHMRYSTLLTTSRLAPMLTMLALDVEKALDSKLLAQMTLTRLRITRHGYEPKRLPTSGYRSRCTSHFLCH